jgi:hypothetical protein
MKTWKNHPQKLLIIVPNFLSIANRPKTSPNLNFCSIKIAQRANLALFWDCCKRPKSVISGNLSKNGHVWATQWSTSSELKIKFDSSLDRSCCEFFKIIKNHGPKNPPPDCNLGPKFSASGWSLVRKKNDDLAVQYEDCPWLTWSSQIFKLKIYCPGTKLTR